MMDSLYLLMRLDCDMTLPKWVPEEQVMRPYDYAGFRLPIFKLYGVFYITSKQIFGSTFH